MKLIGTSCHEISQNSFGDTTCFLHEDHRKKKSKEMQKDMLYIKRKIEFWKRESRKKALSPRTVNSRDGNLEKE